MTQSDISPGSHGKYLGVLICYPRTPFNEPRGWGHEAARVHCTCRRRRGRTATRRVCAAARAARSIIGLRKKWRKDLRGGHVTCVYFRNVCCCNCSNRYGTAASAAERIYLRCSLVGSSGTYTYTLRIDFGAPRITLIGSNEIDLKVERLDDALIIATLNPLPTVKLEWKMSDLPDWPDTAAKIQFRLNRITGDAAVDYLRQQQTTRTGVDWAIVMDGLSQKGTCSKSERAF